MGRNVSKGATFRAHQGSGAGQRTAWGDLQKLSVVRENFSHDLKRPIGLGSLAFPKPPVPRSMWTASTRSRRLRVTGASAAATTGGKHEAHDPCHGERA